MIRCQHCARDFGSPQALAQHSKAKHAGARPITCSYCGNAATFYPSSAHIYARDYGPVWACMSCLAWVGCHSGTTKPLGRLADKELRERKQQAHRDFDPIWQRGYLRRNDAYAELARRMGISRKLCHIGMFDLAQCDEVLRICRDLGPQMRVHHQQNAA